MNESALGLIHFDQDPSVTAVEGSPRNFWLLSKEESKKNWRDRYKYRHHTGDCASRVDQ